MKLVVLLILDGWGINRPWRGNAISQARTPTYRLLSERYPLFSLQASGIAVGLPWGEPGNSEVGHLTIGAGRIVMQYLPRIATAIADGTFFENEALKAAAGTLRNTGGRLHLAGLVSSGTVHAYLEHLYGLLEFAKREAIPEVYLHIFTDGMDSPPRESRRLLPQLEERLKTMGVGAIASVTGRTFAMDRTGAWERTQKALAALLGTGEQQAPTLAAAFAATPDAADAVFPPTVLTTPRAAARGALQSGDALIFFNFREDSMRQLAQALLASDFPYFPRPALPTLAAVVTFTQYDATLPARVAFPPPPVTQTLAEIISRRGKTQLHIAEREKYAHVTFFFNAWRREPFPGEIHALVEGAPSLKNPAGGSAEIARRVAEAVRSGTRHFIVANIAAADVLAHTGDVAATVRGIEAADAALASVAEAVRERDGLLVVTSDHGHAEEMVNPLTNETLTEHTAYPVPCLLVRHELQKRKGESPDWLKKMRSPEGVLADIAPTVLSFLAIPQPAEMTGRPLMAFDASRAPTS